MIIFKHSLVEPQFSNFDYIEIAMPQSVYNFFNFNMPQRHLDLALPPIGHWLFFNRLLYLESGQRTSLADSD